MKANLLLKENIRTLLSVQKKDQHSLAMWLGKSDPWISKALSHDRDIRLKDLDRIGDFFGVATYQLFQPGLSSLTERRVRGERRSGRDRRISQAQRLMLETVQTVTPARRRLVADRLKIDRAAKETLDRATTARLSSPREKRHD